MTPDAFHVRRGRQSNKILRCTPKIIRDCQRFGCLTGPSEIGRPRSDTELADWPPIDRSASGRTRPTRDGQRSPQRAFKLNEVARRDDRPGSNSAPGNIASRNACLHCHEPGKIAFFMGSCLTLRALPTGWPRKR